MIAGRLKRRVAILTQSTVQDQFGQPLKQWATVYSCWASIDVQNSQLLYSTAEFMSKVTSRITIRWTSSVVITAAMRIVYVEPSTQVSHTYEVVAPMNTKSANTEIVILCYELGGAE